MTNLIFIPDVHGEFDLLWRLWTELLVRGLNLDAGDKVIFGGDMIDRGLRSRDVVQFIRDLVDNNPGSVIALKGNHEDFAIEAHRYPGPGRQDARECWCRPNNGGAVTLASFGGEVPSDVLDWFESLPIKHEEPGFFFSHAPAPRENRRSIMVRDTTPWTPFSERELIWTYSKDEFGVARDFGNGTVGVCGHIHKLEDGIFSPRFYPHYIFADSGSGCHERAPLVAIEVKTREVVWSFPQQAPENFQSLVLARAQRQWSRTFDGMAT